MKQSIIPLQTADLAVHFCLLYIYNTLYTILVLPVIEYSNFILQASDPVTNILYRNIQ